MSQWFVYNKRTGKCLGDIWSSARFDIWTKEEAQKQASSSLSLQVMNSQVDPDLARSAVEAVSQWRYTPTLLNGEPIEVDTTIMVNFSLAPKNLDSLHRPREPYAPAVGNSPILHSRQPMLQTSEEPD